MGDSRPPSSVHASLLSVYAFFSGLYPIAAVALLVCVLVAGNRRRAGYRDRLTAINATPGLEAWHGVYDQCVDRGVSPQEAVEAADQVQAAHDRHEARIAAGEASGLVHDLTERQFMEKKWGSEQQAMLHDPGEGYIDPEIATRRAAAAMQRKLADPSSRLTPSAVRRVNR